MNSPNLSHQFTWKFGSASFTSTAAAGATAHSVTIPAERVGLVFVFRTFERISYALVVQADATVEPNDYVRTP